MEWSIQSTGDKNASMTQFRKHNINHTIVERQRDSSAILFLVESTLKLWNGQV